MASFLFFNADRLKCIRGSDAFGDPDFYFTWQVYIDKPGDLVPLHQGFSMGAPIDEGHSVAQGATIPLTDTRYTVELPPVAEGEEIKIVTDLFCWESDQSSAEVKALFTNAAASKLFELYEANQQRKEKTIKEFMDWIKNDGLNIVTIAAPQVAPFVPIINSVFGLIEIAIRAIKSDSDDFIGMSRTELFVSRKDGRFRYRYLTDGGVQITIDREVQPYFVMPFIREANGDNIVQLNALFQVIFDLADRAA